MKKITTQLVLSTAMIIISSSALAQLGNLTKSLGGGSSTSSNVSSEQIVSKYVVGSKNVLNADAKMLEAVGLKDESAKAALQAKNLTEGATKDNLEEANKVQTESSKALEAKLNGQKVNMDAASKKLFSSGVKDLAVGVLQYVGMSKDAGAYKPNLMSLNSSAKSAVFVAKSAPGSIKNLGETLKMVIEYSKANDIPVPKEANDATAAL